MGKAHSHNKYVFDTKNAIKMYEKASRKSQDQERTHTMTRRVCFCVWVCVCGYENHSCKTSKACAPRAFAIFHSIFFRTRRA